MFQFPDSVRIVRLLSPDRPVGGSGATRQPKVGDIGTVVDVTDSQRFQVEAVDSDGCTIWLADFDASELELVARP